MESHFTILLAPNKSHRKTAPKFATSGLVANAAKQSCPQYMRLGFAHGALEAEYQSIIEQRRMINAVAVTDEGIGETAKIEQAIPVCVVAGEARDFEAKHDAYMAEGDFGDQTGEAASLDDAGSGNPEVFVNYDHLLRRPTQRRRFGSQCVLTLRGLSIVLDLSGRGLSQIHIGDAVQMRDTDLGDIIHLLTPVVWLL
jgi:hypothetical protein